MEHHKNGIRWHIHTIQKLALLNPGSLIFLLFGSWSLVLYLLEKVQVKVKDKVKVKVK